MRPETGASTVLITLVHGTWARGLVPFSDRVGKRLWCGKESKFCRELIAELAALGVRNVHVAALAWSGANSIFSRDSASRRLAALLDAQAASNPDAIRIVIGHSHGGNVAVRSFSHMSEPSHTIRLVTLATPFLEVIPDESELLGVIRQTITAGACFASLVTGSALMFGQSSASYWQILILLLSLLLLGLGLLGSNASFKSWLCTSTSTVAYQNSGCKTLVLRGIDDEASLSLGFGALVSRLSQVLSIGLCLIGILDFATFMTIAIVAFALSVISEQAKEAVLDIAFFLYEMNLSLIYQFICAIAFAVVMKGIAPAVFGRELCFTYQDIFIYSGDVPHRCQCLQVSTLPPERGLFLTMRHSLYDHDTCARTIVAWAASFGWKGTP